MNTYRFMTCNVRTQTTHDGENEFFKRVEFLGTTLEEIRPDVIGFQELSAEMRMELIKYMPSYYIVGGGRDASRLSEAAAIGFLKDKFLLEQLTTEILSPTPHVPGTTYGGDQSSCPRAFCMATLKPYNEDAPFRFMNVHTDHIGQNARMFETIQMLQALSRDNERGYLRTVITGDFNATPDAREIQLMLEYNEGHLIDGTVDVPPTFHDYDRLEDRVKIDYVFLSKDWELKEAQSFHNKKGSLFLSDHDPVMVTVE